MLPTVCHHLVTRPRENSYTPWQNSVTRPSLFLRLLVKALRLRLKNGELQKNEELQKTSSSDADEREGGPTFEAAGNRSSNFHAWHGLTTVAPVS